MTQKRSGSGMDMFQSAVCVTAVVCVLCLLLSACGMSAEEQWQEQYDLGQQYLLELDYEQAIVAFTAAIEIDENNVEAYVARAEAYMGGDVDSASEENLKLALADYDTAIMLDEANADVYLVEAGIYILLDDYLGAAQAYTAAIEGGILTAEAYMGRADAYYAFGMEDIDQDEAGAEIEDLTKEERSYLTAARDDYESVLELGGASENTYIHAAEICVITGDYDHAAEILAEGEEALPGSETISDMAEKVALLIEEREQQALIAEQRQVIEDEYWDVLMTLVAVLAENPEDVGTTYWYGNDFLDFADSLIETQYWEMENDLWMGVYPEGYIYYGEMADGERSGYGVWYWCNPVSEETLYDMGNGDGKTVNYLFVGEWRDDYPNGWGTYYYFFLELYDDAISAEKAEFEMNFVNGFASGSGVFRTTGRHGSGECVIEAGEDGTLVYLYTSDGEHSYNGYIEETGMYYFWGVIRIRGALQW